MNDPREYYQKWFSENLENYNCKLHTAEVANGISKIWCLPIVIIQNKAGQIPKHFKVKTDENKALMFSISNRRGSFRFLYLEL